MPPESPMRVLHLIDGSGPQACATTLALLNAALDRLGDVEQEVLLLGGEHLHLAAQTAGLITAQRISTPFGHAVCAWPALRSRLRDSSTLHRKPDLIHCWSSGALMLARLLFRHTPCLLTVTVEPDRPTVQWLRLLVGAAPAQTVLLPISATIRHALLTGGVPEPAVRVLRPGLDLALATPAMRPTLREHWGCAGEEFKVVAILSDPPQAADAIAATMAMGLAAESSDNAAYQLRLLVHPDQRNRRRAQNLLARSGRGGKIIVADRPTAPWLVLPGCDAALAMGPYAGGLSLLWAMAANVPIVGQATYAISEIVEDRHSALLARPDQIKFLSHRLTQVFHDAQLSWQLRDSARHEAFSYFSRQRYGTNLRTVYEQIRTGQTVEVPAMEPTGGLRFTGRG